MRKILTLIAALAALLIPLIPATTAEAVTGGGIGPYYLGKTYDPAWERTYRCEDAADRQTVANLVYWPATDAYYLTPLPEPLDGATVLAYCDKYPLR